MSWYLSQISDVGQGFVSFSKEICIRCSINDKVTSTNEVTKEIAEEVVKATSTDNELDDSAENVPVTRRSVFICEKFRQQTFGQGSADLNNDYAHRK